MIMLPIFISAINNDSDRSFAAVLYEQHRDKVYKTVNKILKDEKDAEDATADTLIKIIDNIKDYYNKSEDELISIIIIIAKNTAIDKYRRNKKIAFVPIIENDKEDDETEYENYADDPCNLIIEKDTYEKLYKEIVELDYEYRQIIILKLLHDYSDKEVAETLNITENNVRIRYYRAKKQLKKYLTEEKQHEYQ